MEPEVPLIGFNPNGALVINTEANNSLRQGLAKTAVVSILGSVQSGKRTLLRELQNSNEFIAWPVMDQVGKSLWISKARSSTPTPVYLCSKGLFGTGGEHDDQDLLLLVAAILVSDVIIVNTVRELDFPTLQTLSQAAQVAHSISAEPLPDAQARFPAFIWAARDTVCPNANDSFELFLAPRPGFSIEVIKTNAVRKFITTYFKDRNCVAFPPPQPADPFRLSVDFLRKLIDLKAAAGSRTTSVFGDQVESVCSVISDPSKSICVVLGLSADRLDSFEVCEAAIGHMRKKILDLRAKLPMSTKLLKEQTKLIKSSCQVDGNGQFGPTFENAFVDAVSEVLEVNVAASTVKCQRQLVTSFAEVEANIR